MEGRRFCTSVSVLWILIAALTGSLLCAGAATDAAAQAPHPAVWQAQYSFDSRDDRFTAIAPGAQGAVYCLGTARASESTGALLLVKYADEGSSVRQAWARTLSAPEAAATRGVALAVARDGTVLVAGNAGTAPPESRQGRDILVAAYSSGGQRLWTRVWNGPAGRDDFCAGLGVDRRGNAYLAGTSTGARTGADYVTLKLDRTGHVRWVRRWNGPGDDVAAGIAVDPSGDTYTTGTSDTTSSVITKVVTLRRRPDGSLRWRRHDPAEYSAGASAIARFGPGGVIVAGTVQLSPTDWAKQGLIVELRANGTNAWRHNRRPGENHIDETLAGVAADGDFISVAGTSTDPQTGVVHGFLAGLTLDGTHQWRGEYTLADPLTGVRFEAVAGDAAGDVCAGGAAHPAPGEDQLLVHYRAAAGPAGDWDYLIAGTAPGAAVCSDVLVTSDGIYAAGELTNAGSGVDAVLVKL